MPTQVQVDDWRRIEAGILNGAAAEYGKIAQEFEAIIANLNNLGKTIFGTQISGAPADLLLSLWNEWLTKGNPLVGRLYALSGDLTKLAKSWESTYQQQKSAAEKQAQEAAAAAAAQPKA